MADRDNRIVSMEFDNSNFERNVKTSMDTLDKLDEKLQFKGAGDGFHNLEAMSGKVDFSALLNSIQNIEKAFTPMGYAFYNVWNDVINKVKAKVAEFNKLVFEDPYKDGFKEYELKMGSVQTIMASTHRPLEEVNRYLEELNTYSDRTIYSFSDMTNNIGKFTNAGVELEDAVAAIKGISNEAALSGATANEASRAMYNFSQALSAGAVKLIDWKSIENANMATVEFKQELINTALALGTVARKGDEYVPALDGIAASTDKVFSASHGFNEYLKDEWLTSDVLVQTLKRYTDETTDLGQRAYAAATEVKTFSMMMDTLKESMGSGWAQSFEIIIGDFNEAKEMFTKITAIFDNIIQRTATIRNNILKIWDASGGREKVLNTIYSGLDRLESKYNSFLKMVLGENYDKLIGDINDELGDISEAIQQITDDEKKFAWEVWNQGKHGSGADRVAAAEELGLRYEVIQEYINGIASGSNTWNAYQDSLNKKTEDVKDNIEEVKETIEDISNGKVSKTVGDILNTAKNLGKAVINIGIGLKNIASIFVNSLLKNLNYDKLSGGVEDVSKGVLAVSERFRNWTENTKVLEKVFDTVFSVINKAIDAIGSVYKVVRSIVTYIWSQTPKLGDAIKNVTDKITSNEKIITFWNKVKSIFESVKVALSGVKDYLELSFAISPLRNIGNTFEKIKIAVKGLIDGGLKWLHDLFFESAEGSDKASASLKKSSGEMDDISKIFNTLGSIFKSLFNFLKELVIAVGPIISQVLDGMSEKLKNLDFSAVMQIVKEGGLIYLVYTLTNAFKSFGSVGDSISGLLGKIGDAIEAHFSADKPSLIRDLAISIAILAGSMFVLALLNPERLMYVFRIVEELIVVIGVLIIAVNEIIVRGQIATNNIENGLGSLVTSIGNVMQGFRRMLRFLSISAVLYGLSVFILSIVTSLKIISSIDKKKAKKSFNIIIGMLSAIIAFLLAVSRLRGNAEDYMAASYFISSLSKSINKIAKALVILTILLEKTENGQENLLFATGMIIGIISAFALLTLVSHNLGGSDGGKGIAKMIKSIGNILLMIGIVALILSENDIEQTQTLFMGMMGVITSIALMIASTRIAGEKNLELLPFVIRSMVMQMLAIAAALWLLKDIDNEHLEESVACILIISGAMTLFSQFFRQNRGNKFDYRTMLSAAASVVIIAAAIGLLATVIDNVRPESVIAALAGIGLALIGIFFLLNNIKISSTQQLQAVASIVLLAGAIALIAAGLSMLSKSSLTSIATAIGGIVVIMGAFMGMAVAMTTIAPAIGFMIGAMVTLSVAIMNVSRAFFIGTLAISAVVSAIAILLAIFEAFGGDTKKFGEAIKKILGQIYDAASIVAEIGIKILAEFLKGISKYLPEFVDQIGYLILQVLILLDKWIYPLANAAIKFLVNVINTIAILIAENAGGIVDAIFNVIYAIAVVIDKLLIGILERVNIGGWADDIIDSLDYGADYLTNEMKASRERISNELEELGKDYKPPTFDFGGAFDLSNLTDKLNSGIDGGISLDSVSAMVGGVDLDVSKMTTGFENSNIQDAVNGYLNIDPTSGEDIFNQLGVNNMDAYADGLGSFDALGEGMDISQLGAEGMELNLDMFEDTGYAEATTLADQMAIASPQTYAEGQLMSQDGANGIAAEDYRYNAAAEVVVGAFIAGIQKALGGPSNNNSTTIYGNGYDMALTLLIGFKNGLNLDSTGDDNSFIDAGRQCAEALATGLRNAKNDLGIEAENTASAIARAVDDELSDYEPVVNARVNVNNDDIKKALDANDNLFSGGNNLTDTLKGARYDISAIQDSMNKRAPSSEVFKSPDGMSELVKIAKQIAETGGNVYLDGDTIVGAISSRMNEQLGTAAAMVNYAKRGTSTYVK